MKKLRVIENDGGGLPKGHECECGNVQSWPSYVYAHYRDELAFECPDCKKTILIQAGSVLYKA